MFNSKKNPKRMFRMIHLSLVILVLFTTLITVFSLKMLTDNIAHSELQRKPVPMPPDFYSEVERAYTLQSKKVLSGITTTIGIIAGGLTLLVLFANRQFSRRIEKMNEVLSKVQSGMFNERISDKEINKKDELAELARHINRALDENTRLMMGLEAVSQTAAHEINKELSHLHNLATKNDQLEMADSANALLTLLREILELSKIESSTDVGMSKVDLCYIALMAAKLYQDAFDDAGIDLIKPTNSAEVLGQEHLLINAITNLLNNALKYTPAGGQVVISISAVNGTAMIAVSDTGDGADSDDLAEILQQAQQGKVAGYGFGLRFVQAVSIRHGAKLRIENISPGFKVSLTFPTHNGVLCQIKLANK
jgi:signal transduction histidine kinase